MTFFFQITIVFNKNNFFNEQHCPGTALFDPVLLICLSAGQGSCKPAGILIFICPTYIKIRSKFIAEFVCPSDGFWPFDVCSNSFWICIGGSPYLSVITQIILTFWCYTILLKLVCFFKKMKLQNCPGPSVFDPSITACIPIGISSCAPGKQILSFK